MDAGAIQDHIEYLQFELARPLLVMKAPKGILGCGYINVETCNKTGEACAIVIGVNSFEDMKRAKVVSVSSKAAELGVAVGETGASALDKLR
ncbi:YunC family protein [Ralstonia pseudosolanacearum]|uniref:YunC family protein n=1 Tax=Ralstonia pseudosolanacearum TaxID=1310165 RepID=UPI003CF16EC0